MNSPATKRKHENAAAQRRDLLDAAARAARCAHAPYSKYCVGAAVLTTEGRVFTGCNVENASYGLTICAERVAVFSAIAAGCRTIAALAVVAEGAALPYPCGACRQVLAEFCRPDVPVYIARNAACGHAQTITLGRLLPLHFRLVTLPAGRTHPVDPSARVEVSSCRPAP